LKSPEKGICRVYDLSGTLLQTAPVVAGDNEIPLKTKGLCILSVDCNGKVASHKIHVKGVNKTKYLLGLRIKDLFVKWIWSIIFEVAMRI